MVVYIATSLEDIAKNFESKAAKDREHAGITGITKKASDKYKATAFVWEQAAFILRHTKLEPVNAPD